jgi:hypothetical protein
MKKLLAGAATAGFIFAAGLSVAGVAAAEPLAGGSAADAVNSLQARGYDVEVQGDTEAPLAECTATQISGLSGSNSNGQAGVPKGSTVYVTVACDDDHDE